MKTHEFARALTQIAELLKSGPNIDLGDLGLSPPDLFQKEASQTIAVNLSTLVGLSRIDKKQWQNFVIENGLPIQLRPRDASRDILGKVLTYLDQHADARERIKQAAVGKRAGQTSSELMKAFSILLGDAYGPSSKGD